MQIKKMKIPARVRLVTLVVMGNLSGCEHSAVSGPLTPDAKQAYEIVTHSRPEPVTAYFKVSRATYEICVADARRQGVPVKPFIEVPKKFVTERQTYSSDGKSYYFKYQQFGPNLDQTVVEKGCLVRLQATSVIERVRDGKVERLTINPDGTRSTDPVEEQLPISRGATDATNYSAGRTENGIALRCLPKGSVILNLGVVSESCVVDAGDGRTLRDDQGKPIIAYKRTVGGAELFGVIVLEPESVRIGKVDASLLSGELK